MIPSIEPGISIHDDDRLITFDHVPSYSEFYDRCLLPNRPCILPWGLVAEWNVIRSNAWAQDSGVNWSALKQHYGSHRSPVVITRTSSEERTEMTISDAVDLIQHPPRDVESIYIKDWHLVKQLSPDEAAPYSVPGLFADDWMNNLTNADKDDFRFVYAGTAGSQTLLHRDVYTSYSWSTNVVGEKRWCLFPPRVIAALRRFPRVETSELIPDVESLLSTVAKKDSSDFPLLEEARSHMQAVHQQPGETIFIPSNWYHQVSNVTDCISINRNWCNSVNLPSLYRSIVDELKHAEDSLCDVRQMLSEAAAGEEWKREFYALVQDVAVQDAGWAWRGFWDMVLHNLRSPATREELRPRDDWMRERLMPLVVDFLQREDARWLDERIRETAQKCRELLESKG